MSSAAAQIRAKAALVADFLAKLPSRPLLVSMQGPQGSGKSSIAAALVGVLGARGVQCTVASLDDFYLPHEGLRAVAARHPDNALLSGRGPPGTHDLPVLSAVLADIRAGRSTEIPQFDKSLHGGEGDRAGFLPVPPPDVFVLEGWSLGFRPLPERVVAERHAAGRVAARHPLKSLLEINTNLAEVERATKDMFAAHVTIRPPEYGVVYEWRLQQEHAMKAKNGGVGMSDAQVRAFVDRYMPVYEVYGEEKVEGPSLVLTFGREREVLSVEEQE